MLEKIYRVSQIADFVMIADYFIYRLTGKQNQEYTITTQLVNHVFTKPTCSQTNGKAERVISTLN
jgi:sugar (pentulose or hexulose) kinase